MRLGLLACLWLAACAPEPTASPPSEPVLVEGGVVEGRFVRAAGLQLALPSPTPHVARNGETLLAAYPYQLLVYRNGFIQDSLPLPGVPTFVRARPLPLVGLDDRLFVPGQGSRLYKARDALHTPEGVYWLDEQGVSLERRRLAEGRYSFLAAGERYVYALGPEALRLPDRLRFPLPAGVKAAVVLEDLYILTPQGLFRLSPEGLRLGFRAGVFSGLQSDGVYLYTLEAGRLLTLRLNLDPASRTLFPAWASHPDPSALHLEVP